MCHTERVRSCVDDTGEDGVACSYPLSHIIRVSSADDLSLDHDSSALTSVTGWTPSARADPASNRALGIMLQASIGNKLFSMKLEKSDKG